MAAVIPFLFVALLVTAIFFGTIRAVSLWGGWQQLGRFYAAAGNIDGPRWRFQSAVLRNGMNYSVCLTYTVNTEGMHVSMFFHFRFGHPDLFFPWSDITASYEEKWYGKYVRFQLAKAPSAPFRIEQRLAEKIAATIGPVWMPSVFE